MYTVDRECPRMPGRTYLFPTWQNSLLLQRPHELVLTPCVRDRDKPEQWQVMRGDVSRQACEADSCTGVTIVSTTYVSTIHRHVVIVCMKRVVICLFQVEF